MQDGNTMRNNYGCDLDSLTTGSRIGMMRTANGDLHYYINGVDQGVACTGLPGGREQPLTYFNQRDETGFRWCRRLTEPSAC